MIRNTIAFCMATVALLTVSTLLAGESEVADMLPMGGLAHAAEEMERASSGKILEIRLLDEKGDPVFEAAVVADDAVVYMRLAAVTDVVTEIDVAELPAWLMNYKMQAYMRSSELAKVPLVEAILRAENKAQAPAIGAGIAKPLSGGNAVLAYYVETTKGRSRKLMAVDAKTGAMIANPEALYERWTPVKLLRRLAP